jgi:ATP-binding protein involved in chromosome partitioning
MAEYDVNDEQILSALESLIDLESGKPVTQSGQTISIRRQNQKTIVLLGISSHDLPLKKEWEAQAQLGLNRDLGAGAVELQVFEEQRKPAPLGQIGLTVKSVIAVASGKGGVGKSTVSGLLALGLQRAGCRVGLLDADVYGPSIPHLLGLSGQPGQQNGKIIPLNDQGLAVMSIGFMVLAEQAIIWRGPMLHSALTNFLRDTNWGELDYLIIDMPPGTGDVALSLSQMIPLSGAVVVCTPQDVALIDAVKSIAMFNKVKIPIIGLVENMSGFVCPDNGIRYDIFGRGGAKDYANQQGYSVLGELPIFMPVRQLGDQGKLRDVYEQSELAPTFEELVRSLVRRLAEQAARSEPLPSLPML